MLHPKLYQDKFSLLLPITRRFSISQLFDNGESGAWYDPSDLDTLYQLSTGVTPVDSDNDPVGTMLDKSLWSGKALDGYLVSQPENVTNGGFDTDTDWTKQTGWSIGGGVASCIVGSSSLLQGSVSTSNIFFRTCFDITAFGGAGAGMRPRVGGTFGFFDSGVKTSKQTIKAGGTTLELQPDPASDLSIDNVSVKEIEGAHAEQSISASRPTYKTGGILQGDGVDDYLSFASVGIQSAHIEMNFNGITSTEYIFGGSSLGISYDGANFNISDGLNSASVPWTKQDAFVKATFNYLSPEWEVFIDGVSIGVTSGGDIINDFSIDTLFALNTPASYCSAPAKTILFVDRPLTDAEISRLQGV